MFIWALPPFSLSRLCSLSSNPPLSTRSYFLKNLFRRKHSVKVNVMALYTKTKPKFKYVIFTQYTSIYFSSWTVALYTAWKVSNYGVISGPYFPVFGLNTEIYEENLRIQSEYRKIRTRVRSILESWAYWKCTSLTVLKLLKNLFDQK